LSAWFGNRFEIFGFCRLTIGPPWRRSFGIKDLAMTPAKSLKNKLLVRYFGIKELGMVFPDLIETILTARVAPKMRARNLGVCARAASRSTCEIYLYSSRSPELRV